MKRFDRDLLRSDRPRMDLKPLAWRAAALGDPDDLVAVRQIELRATERGHGITVPALIVFCVASDHTAEGVSAYHHPPAALRCLR